MGLDISASAKNNNNTEDKVSDQSLKGKNWSNKNKEFCCLAFPDTQGFKIINFFKKQTESNFDADSISF